MIDEHFTLQMIDEHFTLQMIDEHFTLQMIDEHFTLQMIDYVQNILLLYDLKQDVISEVRCSLNTLLIA